MVRWSGPTEGNWEEVGEVWVDSGCVMIGDPCYTQGTDATDASKDWDEFLAKTWPVEFAKAPNNVGQSVYDRATKALSKDGIGIVVSSGYGDGSYPVYIRRNKEGRVIEAKVVFIEDED